MESSLLVLLAFIASAQQWKDNLPQAKVESVELTFYDIQKAINDGIKILSDEDWVYIKFPQFGSNAEVKNLYYAGTGNFQPGLF